jgi:hypothetical protein
MLNHYSTGPCFAMAKYHGPRGTTLNVFDPLPLILRLNNGDSMAIVK